MTAWQHDGKYLDAKQDRYVCVASSAT